jgi:hypothetical protein
MDRTPVTDLLRTRMMRRNAAHHDKDCGSGVRSRLIFLLGARTVVGGAIITTCHGGRLSCGSSRDADSTQGTWIWQAQSPFRRCAHRVRLLLFSCAVLPGTLGCYPAVGSAWFFQPPSAGSNMTWRVTFRRDGPSAGGAAGVRHATRDCTDNPTLIPELKTQWLKAKAQSVRT